MDFIKENYRIINVMDWESIKIKKETIMKEIELKINLRVMVKKYFQMAIIISVNFKTINFMDLDFIKNITCNEITEAIEKMGNRMDGEECKNKIIITKDNSRITDLMGRESIDGRIKLNMMENGKKE